LKDIDFKNELNAEQYAAATAGDGPMLILAAAGTGKTRTLVYRVAYLVSQGVDPNRILLLTFTNKAAREMLERANQLIGHSAGIAWNGTFHHVANRILRKHARALGYSSDYVIMDQDDSRTLMNGCIKELKLNSKEFPKKDVLLHVLSISVNSEISLEKAVADYFADHDVAQADVLQVIRLYIERKRELGNMDFDDMLTNCLRLLRENRSIRERYAEQFQYVLVDEYQDTNKIQADIVDLLSSHHRNLFVVGDDFQSIYSWRGADYRNIIFFKERYPEAQIYKLETNYRSVPEVLRVANRTVEESDHPEEFLKQLKSTREAYKKPVVARLRRDDHRLHLVVVGAKGWLYEEFFRRIEELGQQDAVHVLGYVPDADLPAVFRAATLYVMASVYEGAGLPVLEAMASGLPVVATRIAGNGVLDTEDPRSGLAAEGGGGQRIELWDSTVDGNETGTEPTIEFAAKLLGTFQAPRHHAHLLQIETVG